MYLYLIYATIPASIYDSSYKFILPSESIFQRHNNEMKGLYAWTLDKSLLKSFMKERGDSGIYTLMKKEVDDDYMKEFSDEYTRLKLNRYSFDCYVNDEFKKIRVTTTRNENVNVNNDGNEYMIEALEELMTDAQIPDIFTKKMRKALNNLGYYESYKMFHGEPYYDRVNGKYYYEQEITEPSESSTFALNYKNKLEVLLYLYGFMFTGPPKEKEND